MSAFLETLYWTCSNSSNFMTSVFIDVLCLLCVYGVYYVSMVYFMYLLSVLCIYGSFYASVVCTIDAGL